MGLARATSLGLPEEPDVDRAARAQARRLFVWPLREVQLSMEGGTAALENKGLER